MPISSGALSWPKSYWSNPDSDAGSSRNGDVTDRSDTYRKRRRIHVRGTGEGAGSLHGGNCCRCWVYCPPWCCICGEESSPRGGKGRDKLSSPRPDTPLDGRVRLTCWQAFTTYLCFRCEERDEAKLRRYGSLRVRRRRCCWCLIFWLCLLTLLLLLLALGLFFWLAHLGEDHPANAIDCQGPWQAVAMVTATGTNYTCCYHPQDWNHWVDAIKEGEKNGLQWPQQGYQLPDCDPRGYQCDVILGIVCDLPSAAPSVTSCRSTGCLLLLLLSTHLALYTQEKNFLLL